ncbi:MAG TPA: amidohydrolase family protein [Pyrinomonadaceae bacterium]|nr:amidohydrolase family protein [Pyrinomonadaceae bacterium]
MSSFRYSRFTLLLIILLLVSCKQRNIAEFISVKDPIVALTHVRVIDGTGSPAREDQTIIIESGRISAIGPTSDVSVPASATALDLSGHTAIPGLVGMHNHLFYATRRGERYVNAPESFAPLYLAAGVTTIRTAGALKLSNDLEVKRSIEDGEMPGPKIHITSPYIDHVPGRQLTPEALAKVINEWADEGATSFKIYETITLPELRTVIDAAHKRGLKVTGHVCAVGFREAARAGIDNLEHGLAVDTEFFPEKKPDECPRRSDWLPQLAHIDVKSAPVQDMIRELVQHRVAVTSTLAIFEAFVDETFELDSRMEEVLSEDAYDDCVARLAKGKADPRWSKVWEVVLKKEMQFEREFVQAGGLLMTGVDPTGWGGVIAGFGDQRGLELLVKAGFSPEEAIRIGTLNGATFLGEADRIGTLAAGKQADIAIIRGNLAVDIAAIRNVVLVFKDGTGYDPVTLIESIRGLVGDS